MNELESLIQRGLVTIRARDDLTTRRECRPRRREKALDSRINFDVLEYHLALRTYQNPASHGTPGSTGIFCMKQDLH